MVGKELLLNMEEPEHKVAQLMIKKKEDIQLLASNGVESSVFIDDALITPANIIIVSVSNERKVCVGKYGEKHFSMLTNNEGQSQLIRIWVDCRKPEGIILHVNNGGVYTKLSNESDNKDEYLAVFVQSPMFTQLSLFDGRLIRSKVSHIFATSDKIMSRLQTVAYSMFNQQFPGFSEHLQTLET